MQIAGTERLILSKITVDDAAFILELMNTPDWLKYNGDRNVKTEAEARDYIANNQVKCYEDFGFGYYKILLKSENLTPIGTTGLLQRDVLDDIDVGFSLLPNYYQKGYGFEAANEILNLAKNSFKIKTVCAITLPTNNASIQLLKKLGLVYQKDISPFEEEDTTFLLFKKWL